MSGKILFSPQGTPMRHIGLGSVARARVSLLSECLTAALAAPTACPRRVSHLLLDPGPPDQPWLRRYAG